MTTELSCPQCLARLRVPEGTVGQPTKCPRCGHDFVIPGDQEHQPALVCAVLADDASPGGNTSTSAVEQNVTAAELALAKAFWEARSAENVELLAERKRCHRWRRFCTAQYQSASIMQNGRRSLDYTVGRRGGFFLALTMFPAVLVLLASIISPSALGYLLVMLFGIVLAGTAYLLFIHFPDDVRLTTAIPRLATRLAEANQALALANAREAEQRLQLAAAEAEYKRLQTAFEGRLQWLRSCQWQTMPSGNFARFLTQALEEHGYQVEPSSNRGPLGADLVAVRDGRRVVVQAAGQGASPVDAQVVEQIHANRGRFDAQVAAVITNGNFLPSARQLAEKLGCRLIDGTQIPELIEGRVAL